VIHDVETRRTAFVSGTPTLLFDGPFDTTQMGSYDVSPEGTHFVMVQADPDATPNRLDIVLNWFEDLKARVPATPTSK
jgi:hypothetical protein